MKAEFCLDGYDCIGFDMDFTMVQYNLPQTFQLLYKCLADYLVKEYDHDEKYFNLSNFKKYEDFGFRGIIYDISFGNFVKLDKDGRILKCTHGMEEVTPEKIVDYYGESKIWPKFQALKKNVHHGDGYWIMENFFLVPMSPILGLLVEEADEKSDIKVEDYTYLHKEFVAAVSLLFQPASFKVSTSRFFQAIKSDPSRYVKKCPPLVVQWLEELRAKGKIIFLITDSFPDFMTYLMNYTMGSDWMDRFDFVIAHANKPKFFQEFHKKRLFLRVDEKLEETERVPASETLMKHTCYTLGSAWKLEELCKTLTGKKKIQTVYFGDSMKSDIYPPKKHTGWDTVAVLEELEAEEIHFHKNNFQAPSSKKMKTAMLLKEEKLVAASSLWGSFFTHPIENERGEERKKINTFWGDIIQSYSTICIPILDYLAELPIDTKIPAFSQNQFGFYPSAPRSLSVDSCDNDNGE